MKRGRSESHPNVVDVPCDPSQRRVAHPLSTPGTLPTTWRIIAAEALSHGQLRYLETVHRALTMAVGDSEWEVQSNIYLVYHYVFDLLLDSLGIPYDRCSPPNPGTLPTTWRRIVAEALSRTQSLCLEAVHQALTTEVGHI